MMAKVNLEGKATPKPKKIIKLTAKNCSHLSVAILKCPLDMSNNFGSFLQASLTKFISYPLASAWNWT